MKVDDMLLEEDADIESAIQKLETLRCKNVYIVKKRKLLASISDGDVRRFLLKKESINRDVGYIANYNPVFFYENEIDLAKVCIEENDMQTVPIVNFNHEVVAILFRNQKIVRTGQNLGLPVVIMAGGKGTRLYPYTKILPKALIPIGELPITELIMNKLKEAGCEEFYLLINHKKDMIRAYFEATEHPFRISFIEETIPLGTGGGLGLLKEKVHGDFILTNCDVIVDMDYSRLYKYHRDNQNFITLVVADKCETIPYGVITLDEQSDYQSVKEKPVNNYLINTGFYIVDAKVINEMELNCNVDFPDIIDKYKKQGKRIGVYTIGEKAFMDMGHLEELEKMRQQLGV